MSHIGQTINPVPHPPLTQPGSWALKIFVKLLGDWHEGQLHLHHRQHHWQLGYGHEHVQLTLIKPWATLGLVIQKGPIGFALAYERRWIETHNLSHLLTAFIRNENAWQHLKLPKINSYSAWLRWYHRQRDNTASGGSRRNIAAHYDLGNNFYRLWLDKTLSYSSAIFADPQDSLEVAQTRKVNRLLNQLQLPAGSSLLEIGCGWGELMKQALNRNLNITALTLSSEQKKLVESELAEAIDDTRAKVELCDYRLHHGEYDGIVSVEMFEAVGEKWWDVYFQKIASLLKSEGRFSMQSISIHPDHFDFYRNNPDFIQRYIFPGGMLPTPAHIQHHAAKAGLKMVDRFDFGQDYALTLSRWKHQFDLQKNTLLALGHDDAFLRRWHYYLSYCEAGFVSKRIDVHQFTFVKSCD